MKFRYYNLNRNLLKIGVFSIFILFIVSSYFIFFQNVNFYKPFQIEINGLNQEEISRVKCVCYTPTDRQVLLNSFNESSVITTQTYAHYSDIVLQVPQDLFEKITIVDFTHGKYVLTMSHDDLLSELKNIEIDSDKETVNIHLSKVSKEHNNIFGIYLSAFLWSGNMRIIYIVLLIVFSIFLVWKVHKIYFKRIKLNLTLVFNKISSKTKVLIDSKKHRNYITILIFVIYVIVFSLVSNFSTLCFNWENLTYHSMGVNFAKGHGISRIGEMEPFEDYEYDTYGKNIDFNYRLFTRYPGMYFYHYPPGYGLFLGCIYSIFGVNPIAAKYIQLLLLVLIASYMPIFGFNIWGRTGFLSGIISSVLFLAFSVSYANVLQPHVLLFFLTATALIVFEQFLKTKSVYALFLFGLIVSLGMLTKIILIVFPITIIVFFVFKFIKLRDFVWLKNLVILIITIVTPIILWGTYTYYHSNDLAFINDNSKLMSYELFETPLTNADSLFLVPKINANPSINDLSIQIDDSGNIQELGDFNKMTISLFGDVFFQKQFVIIATQTSNHSLLHAHNEYIDSGGFNVSWREDSQSFYSNDEMEKYPDWIRVINFYINIPAKIIILPSQKIYRSFFPFRFLTMFLITYMLYSLVLFLIKKQIRKKVISIVGLSLFIVMLFLVNVFEMSQWLYFLFFVISIAYLIFDLKIELTKNQIELPISFQLLVLSQVILTIAVSGNVRFVSISNYVFIFCSVYSIISCIKLLTLNCFANDINAEK